MRREPELRDSWPPSSRLTCEAIDELYVVAREQEGTARQKVSFESSSDEEEATLILRLRVEV